jgi:NTE family protein
MTATQIAIACQGGGSHAAFIAGALKKMLEENIHRTYRVVGVSGTSGGAICALLAWYGISRELSGLQPRAQEQTVAFWNDNTALMYWEKMWNRWVVGLLRLQESGALPEFQVSPYNASLSWMLDEFTDLAPRREFFDLRGLLQKHVNFDALDTLVHPRNPRLLLSAIDVLSGEFKCFNSSNYDVNLNAVMASVAIPTLSKAVHIGGAAYWDGLFSENPPISPFVSQVDVNDKPDEIWVLELNPRVRDTVPESIGDILDRRNELSGMLSLSQEIQFICSVNRWIQKGFLHGNNFKPITLRRLTMSTELLHKLDAISKMDRSASFIETLMEDGSLQAERFLEDPDSHIISC